jgi:hypothetical protein
MNLFCGPPHAEITQPHQFPIAEMQVRAFSVINNQLIGFWKHAEGHNREFTPLIFLGIRNETLSLMENLNFEGFEGQTYQQLARELPKIEADDYYLVPHYQEIMTRRRGFRY